MEFLVRPAAAIDGEYMDVSTLEEISPRGMLRRFFIFQTAAETGNWEIFEGLKLGLSYALAELPHFAGRIIEDPKRNTIRLKRGQDAYAKLVFRDFTEGEDSARWHYGSFASLAQSSFPMSSLDPALLDPEDFLKPLGTEASCTVAQANFIPGGMILSMGLHHAIADGQAAHVFLQSWSHHTSTASKGQPPGVSSHLRAPCDISSLCISPQSAEIATDFPEYTYDGNKNTFLIQELVKETPAKVECCIYYLSQENLQKLKNATSSVGPADPWISTVDSLFGLIWRATTRARQLCGYDDQLESKLLIALNIRKKVPNVPADYPRVASTLVTAKACPEELTSTAENAAYGCASRIRQAIQGFNFDKLSKLLGLVGTLDDVTQLRMQQRFHLGPDILISDQRMLAPFELDWGVGLGHIRSSRRSTMIPITDGTAFINAQFPDGGMEILLGLEKKTMEIVRADEEFMRYATFVCS